jgi:hypothetical protein
MPIFSATPALAAPTEKQWSRPVRDDSRTGTWETTDTSLTKIWSELVNGTDGTATDVRSEDKTTGTQQFRVGMTRLGHPEDDTGHEIVIHARKGSAGGRTVELRAILYDGNGNEVKNRLFTNALDNAYSAYSYTLTQGEVDNIVNYNDMELVVQGEWSGTGDDREMWVSGARFEVPAAEDPSCVPNGTTIIGVSGGGAALQTAMANNGAGTTYCVAAASYTSSGGLPIQANDVINGDDYSDPENDDAPDATVTADDDDQFVIDGQGINGVKIYDMKFVGGEDQPDSEVDDDGDDDDINTIDDNEPQDWDCTTDGDADDCGTTIEPGGFWLLERVHIVGVGDGDPEAGSDLLCDGSDNSIAGGTTRGIGSAGTDLVMRNMEIEQVGQHYECYKHTGDTTTGEVENNGVAAAIKTGEAGAFEAYQMWVHHNDQGIWCDTGCDDNNAESQGLIVYASKVQANGSFGIHYENTWAEPGDGNPAGQQARIMTNVVQGNAWNETNGHDSDIGVVAAIGAFVVDNDMGSVPSITIVQEKADGTTCQDALDDDYRDCTFRDSGTDDRVQFLRGFAGKTDADRPGPGDVRDGIFVISNNRNNTGATNGGAVGFMEETRECDTGVNEFDSCISFNADQ